MCDGCDVLCKPSLSPSCVATKEPWKKGDGIRKYILYMDVDVDVDADVDVDVDVMPMHICCNIS